MKAKKQYLAKNIREGWTIEQAIEFCKDKNYSGSVSVDIDTFNHGCDVNGNGTAHYRVSLIIGNSCPLHIVQSGARREQVGYSGMNESALYALDKLGYKVDKSKHGSYDYQGCASYPLTNWSN